jgi:histidinol-phosphate aminotransferase
MIQEDAKRFLREGVEELEISTTGLSLEEAKRKFHLAEIVKLASNENPLGPSPKAVEAAKGMAGMMHVYPDPPALPLRAVIAQTHGVRIDQVLPGNGSSELIAFIGYAFINQGDECVIPTPTYHRYQEISQLMGARNILVPLKEYRIDWEQMASKVSAKTKLLIIVSPNNPTGDIVRRRELEAFLQQIGKNRIVVLDEAYAEYTDQVRPTFNLNRFAQYAGMEAMKDREYFQRCRQLVLDEKKYYYEAFAQMGLYYLPTSANFIFVGVGVDDQKLHEELVKLGIILRPLSAWGYKGFLRITIGTHGQNEKVVPSFLPGEDSKHFMRSALEEDL